VEAGGYCAYSRRTRWQAATAEANCRCRFGAENGPVLNGLCAGKDELLVEVEDLELQLVALGLAC